MQGNALTGLPAPSRATDAARKGYVDATLPIGGIIMWSGSIDSIPSNWKLCDGQNGTPDLRDRFVLGAGGDYAVGATGGEATHTLTIDEMPAHSHTIPNFGPTGNGWAHTGGGEGGTTDITGGGQPHNNMPPYYALAYIMRVA